jgi:hypothetical protein
LAYSKMAAVWRSTPVADMDALAFTAAGLPRMSNEKEMG